jgi:hypothetical protein
MEDREMLMKEFRKLISPIEILDIRSGATDEQIKMCKANELTEEDMHLNVDVVYASVYRNDDHYSGKLVLSVYQ